MENKIANDIQKLLVKIETDYPELYAFLDEDPLTLQYPTGGDISESDLKSYLESLKQKLEHYKKHG